MPNQYFIPSTNIGIDAVNGQLAINNTLKHSVVGRYVKEHDGSAYWWSPNGSQSIYRQMRLLWPEREDGVGAGKSASFYTKKILNQFRGIETRSTFFVTSLLRNNRYANINCPQTWECESGAFFVNIHPFFYSFPPPFFFSLALAGSQSELKSCIEKHLEVGIMLKPHVWLISMLQKLRASHLWFA